MEQIAGSCGLLFVLAGLALTGAQDWHGLPLVIAGIVILVTLALEVITA